MKGIGMGRVFLFFSGRISGLSSILFTQKLELWKVTDNDFSYFNLKYEKPWNCLIKKYLS